MMEPGTFIRPAQRAESKGWAASILAMSWAEVRWRGLTNSLSSERSGGSGPFRARAVPEAAPR